MDDGWTFDFANDDSVFRPDQPGATIPKEVWKVGPQMALRSGRLERRTPLAIPVKISSLKEPSAGERSTTENVCSLGLRVLVRQARERNERLLIKSADGELRADARVVYCERLGEGRFALGLEFCADVASWVNKSITPGD